ncbi:MAG: ATP-dependent DNA ligase [Armatimonadetes bacterium]|nr:ATP-dependent DNA ligase [Armatimonadota bacterium]
MERFAQLYGALDSTTSTNAKVAAMAEYFAGAPPADAAWALYFLTGRRLKRLLPSRLLREWTRELAGVSEWLFEDCYAAAGDLAETIALLLDRPREHRPDSLPLHRWVEERMLALRALDEAAQRSRLTAWRDELASIELYLLIKLLTGELRVGVSQTLVVRAVAQAAGLEVPTVAQRLMGAWDPTPEFYARLIAADAGDTERSRPYPFYLASALERPPEQLGERQEWLVEWKWDGIRSQLIRRGGEVFLWSRGEELLTDRFPELREAARALPDGLVLDGEVLAWRDQRPLPFAVLQRRIGRQKLSAAILAEAPAAFLGYDLLEEDGTDCRALPLHERRVRLEAVLANAPSRFHLSEAVTEPSWAALAARRAESRERGVEGFMLKRLGSPYRAGRPRGDWWKWKIDPYRIDTVLIYAQSGHGRRATLHTDYTLGVWHEGELVPIAKAYSGLTDAEIDEMDRWIRRHTIERHGPVRVVEPLHVFELAFEGLAPSPRHKAGIALRFPRIARWRRDKPPAEADTLEQVKALLPQQPG